MSPSIDHDPAVTKVVTDPRCVDEVQQFEVRPKLAFDPTWLPTYGDRSDQQVVDRRHGGPVAEQGFRA